MRRFGIFLLAYVFMPFNALAAYISGVDDDSSDRKMNIPPAVKADIDKAFLGYYQAPGVDKINLILDIINNTPLLERKTSWAPMVGFFTEVFPNNKNQVLNWLSRNDYNTHAQYVIVNALLHSKMKETALLFAKAHHWEGDDMIRLRDSDDKVNLKKLEIIVPGHIDTIWGAFFASGDVTYVNKIIDYVLSDNLEAQINLKREEFFIPEGSDPVKEGKSLAATTLRDYSKDHPAVLRALEDRYKATPEGNMKHSVLKMILGK